MIHLMIQFGSCDFTIELTQLKTTKDQKVLFSRVIAGWTMIIAHDEQVSRGATRSYETPALTRGLTKGINN